MERVLWVDDDPDILLLAQRMASQRFDVQTCTSAAAGIAAIQRRPGFAVVVSDMRMPGMDGTHFLARVADLSPESVRVMFTGLDDQATAAQAVNDGHVFLFVNKAASVEEIIAALETAEARYLEDRATNSVLEGTLVGAVRALQAVVGITQPAVASRTAAIRETMTELCLQLGIRNWQIDLAAALSQLGCVSLPPTTMTRIAQGKAVAPDQQQLYNQHPLVGAELVRKIPRLEGVADIIRWQHKRFDGSGLPVQIAIGDAIPLGARLLKVATDFVSLRAAGVAPTVASRRMADRGGWYDPAVLEALLQVAERMEGSGGTAFADVDVA